MTVRGQAHDKALAKAPGFQRFFVKPSIRLRSVLQAR
jgi:hypothetical protein